MINWTEVIVSLCYIIITSVIVPVAVHAYKTKVSKDKQETIEYWVDKGVRWAKQELWDKTNEEKKANVMDYVENKLEQLKIDLTAEDLSVIIEAIYESVKKESLKQEESHNLA